MKDDEKSPCKAADREGVLSLACGIHGKTAFPHLPETEHIWKGKAQMKGAGKIGTIWFLFFFSD